MYYGVSKMSASIRKDLYELVRKHKIAVNNGKHEHEVVSYIMKQIENLQRQEIRPNNWWTDVRSDNRSSGQTQERYHDYITRKNKEEDLKDGRDI